MGKFSPGAAWPAGIPALFDAEWRELPPSPHPARPSACPRGLTLCWQD